jgi:RNA-binding protein YhbY
VNITLSGAEKRSLKSRAQTLDALVRVGQAGLSEPLVASMEDALASHELVKVRFVGLKDERRTLAPELAAAGVQLKVVNPGFVATPLTAKNDFPMPFLMEPEAAAKRIAEGLASGHFEVRFPRRLAWLLGLIAALPYPLYFALTKRMLRPA